MREEPGEGLTPAAKVAAQIAGGVLSAGAMASLGPAGAVSAAALTPVATEMFERALAEWRVRAGGRAAMLVEAATDEAGVELSELATAVDSDDLKRDLFVRSVEGVARSTLSSKVRVLGRALASGALAEDKAIVDDALLRTAVIAEIEAPHLKVLDCIAIGTTRDRDRSWSGVAEADLAEALPGAVGLRSSGLLQPVLRLLERHGLIFPTGFGDIWDDDLADDVRPDAGTNTWGATRFGVSLLAEFTNAGLKEERDFAPDPS